MQVSKHYILYFFHFPYPSNILNNIYIFHKDPRLERWKDPKCQAWDWFAMEHPAETTW